MASVMGWDLGGANLKLARIEGGRAERVAQIPCPIRQDVSKFDAALEAALNLCPPHAAHAVTMTGELSDVFSNRAEGVAYLVDMMRNATDGEALFYGAKSGFLDCIRAVEQAFDVASANWHASAALVAQTLPDALLIDAGTTTTDLVPLKDGAVAARGYTDGERLAESELVYTGVVRTPVMAVARTASVQGPHATHRRRALRHHGRRLAPLGRASRRCRPLPDPRSGGQEHRSERGTACPHAGA